MKIFNKAGSKERLFEMMSRVNKIKLNESAVPVGTKVPIKGLTIDKLGFQLTPEVSKRGVKYNLVNSKELFPSPKQSYSSIYITTDSHLDDWIRDFNDWHGDEGYLVKVDDLRWDVVDNPRFTQWRDERNKGVLADIERDKQRGWSTESVIKEEGGYSDSYDTQRDLRQMQRDEDKRTFSQIVFLQGSEAEEPLEILNNQGEQAALEYLKQWDMGDSYETTTGSGAGRSDSQYQEGNYLMSWNDRIGYIGLERIDEEIKEADDASGYSYDRSHPANRRFQEPKLMDLSQGEQFRYILLVDDDGRYHDIMIPVELYDEHLDQLYRHFGTNSAYQEVRKEPKINYKLSTDILGKSETLKEYDPLEYIDDTSNDDNSDPLPTEPEEEDCIVSSNGWKLSVSCGGKFIGEFEEDDQAYAAVREWKKRNNYFPNTWFISDHGNASLVDDNGNIIGEGINEGSSKLSQIKSSNPALYNQLMVAKKTMNMNDAMAGVMGGMSKEEARQLLIKHGMLKEADDTTSSIDGNYTQGNENYKKALVTDLKNRGEDATMSSSTSELESKNGLFKETIDSVVDFDRAYLDNSVDTEETNVTKYDGGLDYPDKNLRVDSNLLHQEPIFEMDDFRPLTLNYDQKGNWIPAGHEDKGMALRVTYHPIGSDNEKYLVVKMLPDGGIDKIYKVMDNWDKAKEELKKYL
jgi:hypothetical protein